MTVGSRYRAILGAALPAFGFMLSVVLAGCATINGNGSRQVVLARSEPSGAAVIIDDKQVATTPAYIYIRRSHTPYLDVRDDDGDHRIFLPSHYRWWSSFGSNLIFYTFAPLGWLIDVASGAAWSTEDPPLILVHLAHPPKPVASAAIAPPQSPFPLVSDAGGEAIEANLKMENPSASVLPYRQTLDRFVAHGYDYDGRPDEYDRRELYASLGVQTLYESKASYKNGDDEMELKVSKVGVFDDTESAAFDLQLKPESQFESIFTSRRWWARLIPNTVSLTAVNEHMHLASGNQTYDMDPVQENSWWASGLSYLNALDITNTLARRPGHSARWVFDFVPSFRVSRKVVRATGLPDNGDGSDEVFTRWWASAGYGPEVGYQNGRHYFYADLIFYLFWDEISWSENLQYHSQTGSGVEAGGELGYLVTLNQHWVLRLFGRTENEDGKAWAQVLSPRLPAGESDSLQAQVVTLGISFGYRFEPEFSADRWRRN